MDSISYLLKPTMVHREYTAGVEFVTPSLKFSPRIYPPPLFFVPARIGHALQEKPFITRSVAPEAVQV